MIDFFKHVFGLCGESHPNIFTLIGMGFGIILYYIKYIALKINQIIKYFFN